MKVLILSLIFCVVSATSHAYVRECPGAWHVTHKPAAATLATITKAAVSGKRLLIDCVSGSIGTNDTAQTPISLDLKEAASVIASWESAAPAPGQTGFGTCGLGYILATGASATALFDAVNVPNSKASVNMSGCTIAP